MEKTRIHPLVRSQPVLPTYSPIYLPGTSRPSGARRGSAPDGGDEIQFFLFYRTLRCGLYPCFSKERSSPSRCGTCLVAVGRSRICKFRRRIVSAWLPPAPLRASTKDPGQTFIRLGIFIFRSGETTKRVTPYIRPRHGTKGEGMGRKESTGTTGAPFGSRAHNGRESQCRPKTIDTITRNRRRRKRETERISSAGSLFFSRGHPSAAVPALSSAASSCGRSGSRSRRLMRRQRRGRSDSFFEINDRVWRHVEIRLRRLCEVFSLAIPESKFWMYVNFVDYVKFEKLTKDLEI